MAGGNVSRASSLDAGQVPRVDFVIQWCNIPRAWVSPVRSYIKGLGAEAPKARLWYGLLLLIVVGATLFFTVIQAGVDAPHSWPFVGQFLSRMSGNYAAELLSVLLTVVVIERMLHWKENSKRTGIEASTLELLAQMLRAFLFNYVSALKATAGEKPDEYFLGLDHYRYVLDSIRDEHDC